MTFFLEFAEQFAQGIGDTRRPFAVETWEKAYEIWNSSLSSAKAYGECVKDRKIIRR